MSSSKQELKAELQMDLPALTSYLEAIVAGLREGRVYLEHGGRVIGLYPGQAVTLELTAKHKKEKDKLCLEISWVRAEPTEGLSPELKISSQKGEQA